MTLSAACEVCQAIGNLRLEHLGHAELFPSSPKNAADMDLVVQVLCRNSVCYQVNHLTRNNCLKGVGPPSCLFEVGRVMQDFAIC